MKTGIMDSVMQFHNSFFMHDSRYSYIGISLVVYHTHSVARVNDVFIIWRDFYVWPQAKTKKKNVISTIIVHSLLQSNLQML